MEEAIDEQLRDRPLAIDLESGLSGVLSTQPHPATLGVVILNAGLLNRAGPFRLHVEMGRELAAAGVPTLRLDQSGKGDSPIRTGLSRDEAIRSDIDAAISTLNRECGVEDVVLIGLCSGADDILNYGGSHSSVKAIVLLDGFAHRNWCYYAHSLLTKLNARRSIVGRLLARDIPTDQSPRAAHDTDGDAIDIREWRSTQEMLTAIAQLDQQGVRTLAVFTSGVAEYYAYQGQLNDNLRTAGHSISHLTEVYFPHAKHLYPLVSQRSELIGLVKDWLEELVKE